MNCSQWPTDEGIEMVELETNHAGGGGETQYGGGGDLFNRWRMMGVIIIKDKGGGG